MRINDYEGPDVIHIMIASDVLSEGHNLQDCSAVINYDLHWNPVRLIQRAGRVDRIGSVAEIIIKNLMRDKPEYMALIKKMQLGLRSAKRASFIQDSYAFFKSGDFVRLLIKKPDGNVEEDFSNVISEIRCEPDEPEIKMDEKQVENYFNYILKLRDHFSQTISAEDIKTRIEPEVRRAHNRLREIIT